MTCNMTPQEKTSSTKNGPWVWKFGRNCGSWIGYFIYSGCCGAIWRHLHFRTYPCCCCISLCHVLWYIYVWASNVEGNWPATTTFKSSSHSVSFVWIPLGDIFSTKKTRCRHLQFTPTETNKSATGDHSVRNVWNFCRSRQDVPLRLLAEFSSAPADV